MTIEVDHGPFVWNVNLAQADSINWSVRERVGVLHPRPEPGRFYWCVYIKYITTLGNAREFVLESGVLENKVEAFTLARKRTRHYKRLKHEATPKPPLIQGLRGGL